MPRVVKKIRGLVERPKGSGIWWIRYWHEKKEHWEKVGPRGAAIDAYRKRRTEIREGKFFPDVRRRKNTILFDELAKDRLEYSRINNPKSYDDDEGRMKLLLKVFGRRVVSSITGQEIEELKEKLLTLDREPGSPTRKPATIKQYMSLLRATFNLGVRNRKIAENPSCGVRMPKVNNSRLRYLSDDEEQRVLEHSLPWLRPIVRFAILSGCRQGEILSLTWADVDLEFGAVHVRESKSGEGRTVPLPPSGIELLRKLPRHLNENRIFPWSGAYVSHTFAKAAAKAGLEDVRFHDLRHTYGARGAMSGIDPFALQRLMGHKTQAMTQRYVHLSPDYLKRQVAKLDGKADGDVAPKKEAMAVGAMEFAEGRSNATDIQVQTGTGTGTKLLKPRARERKLLKSVSLGDRPMAGQRTLDPFI